MLDDYYENTSGVESQDAADLQTETVEAEETTETTEAPETGEEESLAAGETEATDEQGQEAETKEEQPDRTEVAFSKRLSAEREKVRAEIERDVTGRFEPLLKLAEIEAQKYGMSPVQWAQAVMQNQEQQYYQQLQEQGIDPRLVEHHPAVLRARQYEQSLRGKEKELTEKERLNVEAGELFDAFPDLDAKSIPPEVWQIKDEKGLSLLDAYLRVNYKKLAETAKANGEQAAIAAMRKREKASTGPAKGGATTPASAWELSDKQFKAMLEKSRRGEKVNF